MIAQSADETFLEHKMRLWRNGWLKIRGDVNLRTALHEAVHMIYHRDLGHDPEVLGPHEYEDFLGDLQQANGGVSGLPEDIELSGDAVLVGKTFLGPRFFMLELRGEAERQRIIFKECHHDLTQYNNWYVIRYRLHQEFPHWTEPLPSDLGKQIQAAVHRDFNNPDWQRRVWETTLEYACRIDDQAKAKLDEVEKHGLGPAWVQFHERNSAQTTTNQLGG